MTTASRNRDGRDRRKQAKKIAPNEWDTHKDEIERLYLTDNLTQQEVVDHLKNKRKFGANKRQLISQLKKWGFAKYNTTSPPNNTSVKAVKGKEPRAKQMATRAPRQARSASTSAERGEAAEVHFALSDDIAAWPLAASHEQYRSSGALDTTALIMSRSALTKDQVSETAQILDRVWQTASSNNDDHTARKCRLLKADMQVRNGDAAPEVLGKLDVDIEHLAYSLDGADFLTAYLVFKLNRYSGTTSPPPSLSNEGYSVLEACILWSAKHLETQCDIPIQLDGLDGTTENDILVWREETELFLTLWHRWRTSHGDDLSWVLGAEATLGIAASELLATVGCIILDACFESHGPDGDDDFDDDDEAEVEDGSKLLEKARDGVQFLMKALQDGRREEIWEDFSKMFDRRNTFSSDEAEGPSFNGAGRPTLMTDAVGIIGRFVKHTLAERTVD